MYFWDDTSVLQFFTLLLMGLGLYSMAYYFLEGKRKKELIEFVENEKFVKSDKTPKIEITPELEEAHILRKRPYNKKKDEYYIWK